MRPWQIGIGVVLCSLLGCMWNDGGGAVGRLGSAPKGPSSPLALYSTRPGQDRAGKTTPRMRWNPDARELSPRWTCVVIHHSATKAGGAKLFDKHHRNKGWDGLGYHFVIGNGTDTPDGEVEIGPRWHLQKHGAHCKTSTNYFNEHGIGICLVGDFTRNRPTRRQMASLHRLVTFLARACGISPARVTTHRAVTGKTACPGAKFPLRSFKRQ